MDVFLEKIPQEGHVGPMQVIHWAIRVGSEVDSVCYEFESEGVQMGASTTCDHGFDMKRLKLGVTEKTHKEIETWVSRYGQRHEYQVAGCDFGGRNCQDFATELCQFLGVGSSKLPWRQARQIEGAAFAAAGVVAVGCALLSAVMASSRRTEEQGPPEDGRRRKKKICF
mmetsp:Transcript_96755/g.216792  ORF Transcript_96755/g.216792 Transcript_96755/m.216792 type:complete len:169 (-) Transcript_96755:105-611(-)